jgi:hypothetical protein
MDLVSALLGQNLIGVYEANADVEDARLLLVLTQRDLLRDRNYGLVHTFLRRSGQPAALEALVVRQADVVVEHASVLVQLHYTEGLREQLIGEVGSIAWLTWVDGPAGAVDRGTLLSRLQSSRPLFGRRLPRCSQHPWERKSRFRVLKKALRSPVANSSCWAIPRPADGPASHYRSVWQLLLSRRTT